MRQADIKLRMVKKYMAHICNFIYGILIGAANIIPGVSGGTMAVILGVYDRLIAAVGTLRRRFLENVIFLVPIALGAGTGILLFSHLIGFLLESAPMATNFFFLGLIIGSVPMIYRRTTASGPLKPVYALPFCGALGIMLLISFLPVAQGGAPITALDVPAFFLLLFCSAVAAASMILPGLSGSMVMMILGVYASVLNAISDMNLVVLAPVGLGILTGIFGGAKAVHYCMEHYITGTYCAILGLMAGSVVPVIKNAGFSLDMTGAFALAAFVLGCASAAGLSMAQKWLESRAGRKG